MARPIAASIRMLPSDSPAKIRPSHSARARRAETCASEARAAVRTASSLSAQLPSAFWATIAVSSVLTSARSLSPSACTASSRSLGSSDLIVIAATASATACLTCGSVSFSCALRSVASRASSPPSCRASAAASLSSRSGENSFSAATAPSIWPRRLLLIMTSSGSGVGIPVGLPVAASSTPSAALIQPPPLPSTKSAPSCKALSTGSVVSSGDAAIASMAAAFSSKSSEASRLRISGSTAKAALVQTIASSAALTEMLRAHRRRKEMKTVIGIQKISPIPDGCRRAQPA